MTTAQPHHRRADRWLPLLVMLSAGCSNLTHVSSPDVVQPSAFENPAGALAQRAAVVSGFATSFSSQVVLSGLISDELFFFGGGSGYGAGGADQRIVKSPLSASGGYPYDGLSSVRVQAMAAIQSLQRYSPTPSWHIGEIFAYLGYVSTFFAENMCSGVPMAKIVNGQSTLGPNLTRAQLLQDALANFDSSAKYVGSDTTLTYLTAVGRGRVFLDSGNVIAAATAVAGVPTAFAYAIQYSQAVGQGNSFHDQNGTSGFVSVSDREGINGLPFVSVGDPRVPTAVVQVFPGNVPQYGFVTYSNDDAPITLASGVEAQLIRAEAALAAGNTSAWLDTLNVLRASEGSTAGLAPISDPGTAGARLDTMFTERAFWLFATGHRQGDLRRLIRYYGRQTEHVFPTGPYQGGLATYGTDVTFIPYGEQSNPTFHGCIDRTP